MAALKSRLLPAAAVNVEPLRKVSPDPDWNWLSLPEKLVSIRPKEFGSESVA